jgi:hypothetical protein
MKAHKALRPLLFTFILIAGAISPTLINTPVQAASSTGETTLYFTNALSYLTDENYSGFDSGFDVGFGSFIPMSQNPPTKQNDSEYPPSLILKNTSKLRPQYSLNANEWITWFGSTWLMYFLMQSEEMNLTDIFGDLGDIGIFGDIDIEVLLPNPYRVVEGYTYNGTDPLTINGDLAYNLYFNSPVKQKKFRDQVEVSLYRWNMNSFPGLPKKVANTTAQLTPGLLSDTYNQKITLKDVHFILEPGESLLFAVEIIPCNKTLPTLITKYLDVDRILAKLEKRANKWENRTRIQILQTIGTTIKELIAILDNSSINITSGDIAAIVNALRSSSLIYDSANHPASVIIPAKISEDDIRTYYLHANSGMDESRPVTENQSGSIKLTTTPLVWTGPALERNKIIKVADAVADLYIDHRDFLRIINILRGKITLIATLYDDNTSIATSTKALDRTKILAILTKPTRPITFTFDGIDREITYDHSIRLGVSLENGTKLGLREVKLLYDSASYPSALRVTFDETQNIKITNVTSIPGDLKIIPGDSVTYTFNVTSIKTDTLQINALQREKVGDWEIIVPNATTVQANSWTNINVTAKSKNNTKDTYDNFINLSIVVEGHTGIARYGVSAIVSTDAIHYDIKILDHSSSINISKGEERFFYFIIYNNNTGAIDDVDSYTIAASSRNNWNLTPQQEIRNLGIGKSTDTDDAKVLIEVPMKTNESTDVITITVTSEGNPDASATFNVTVNVIGGGVIEEIGDFFDSAAKALGLTEIFGSDAKYVLILLLVVIILFLLIILALVLTLKPVRVICTERIKEIDATEKATYEVFLQNPSRKAQSYDIQVQQATPSSKWITTAEPQTTIVEGRQSASVQIITTPTEDAAPTDWTQVTVSVKKTGRKKTEKITLLTTLKEGKTLLQLGNVSHWPTIFNQGEKVITSCSLTNNGTISARNVKVFFYLNGKQKNKLDVTVPAGNIADIRIPWIVEKGKNQVRIRVKE